MKRPLVILAAIALLVPLFVAVEAPQSASAADGTQFNAGYIISDANFYAGTSMSGNDVQTFLQQRLSTCRTGYTCLKDYGQATPSIGADSYCAPYAGSPGERAADIIAKVGAACSISPKVLLVLLEKEQSLVTDDYPYASQYNSATGFSCPDTAPCDPAFAGFFYQVYYAARQFQKYAANPGQWNYQAGRTNNILYNPNAACGSSPVYIQNKATAALYIYTPYQPNAAALTNANLYRTGDGCSSYGNRNFWRIYTDWFGSPTESSSLVRTVSDSSVYLTSGGKKYPITSMTTLNALFPLGQVSFVSQSYLDSFTTAQAVGRVLRGPDGSIYFFDAGYKLPFPSCDLVIDYGGSCAASGYVQLTDTQINAFQTGPALSSVLGTAEGARYLLDDGTKREILDARTQAEAGLPANYNVLSENAVASLPSGPPIVRDSVYVQSRGVGSYSLVAGGVEYPAQGNPATLGIPPRVAGSLWPASLAKIPDGAPFGGLAVSASQPSLGLLTDWGRYSWTDGVGGVSSAKAVTVSDEFMASYPPPPQTGTIDTGTMFKTATNGTIYVTTPTDLKPIGSWTAMLSLSPGGAVRYGTVSDRVIDVAPRGLVAMTAGSLVRSPGNATVYIVNGVTNVIALSDFDYTSSAGITGFEVFPQSFIDGYPQSSINLGFGWACGPKNYVASGGTLHEIAPADVALWPIQFQPIDSFTCALMKYGAPATKFIRFQDGSLFLLDGGQKRPVSAQRYIDLGGPAVGYLDLHWRLAGIIPTGPAA